MRRLCAVAIIAAGVAVVVVVEMMATLHVTVVGRLSQMNRLVNPDGMTQVDLTGTHETLGARLLLLLLLLMVIVVLGHVRTGRHG